ncbi:major facilitator transporter [Scytonema sp. HK-05]|uniref:MFS transporter n=1 Tax=Scytonema sp. HK-05 TaxID=1137095 RepID=UPI00093566E8|nr:MFS transporter [Scytonema sp. HK-05]OKH54416.1 MFS transporter [Scytonema sp. HK-05]BAY44310.1 major facilitator transporter [Scytonema sp. HK-05]
MQPASIDNQQKPPKKLYLDTNFQIICAVSLMAVLGVASVSPTFPRLAHELGVNPKNIGLLITFFTFPSLVLGPVIGVLADRLGRKKIIIPSLFLFGIAGTACAFARDFNFLLLLRFLQGIGAASLLSLSITLIGDLYTGDKRTTAMGYNASITSIGTASYPLIGGALATLGWYYPFMLPIIAIPIGLLVLFGLKNPEPQGERNLKEYLLNARQVLKNRQLLGLYIASAANFFLLYGAHVTYLPHLIKDTFKAPPYTIGLLLSSVSIAIMLSASQLGRLSRKFQTTTLIRASFILYALALFTVPLIQNIWLLLIPTTIFGFGLGIGFPSIQTLLTEISPKQYLATILSVNGTFYGLGQTIGPLFMGIVFGFAGINGVFYAGVVFAILTLVVFRYCTCL